MEDNRHEFELFFGLEETNSYEQLKCSDIHVEDMRDKMGVSIRVAREKCDEAVTKGILTSKIGLVCPNDENVMASYDNPQQIPVTITCPLCKIGDKYLEFDTEYLKRVKFYIIP